LAEDKDLRISAGKRSEKGRKKREGEEGEKCWREAGRRQGRKERLPYVGPRRVCAGACPTKSFSRNKTRAR
jgi:hypothetical protein